LTGENRRTRGKTCPSATSSTTNATWTDPGSKPGLRGGMQAANRLSHSTAFRSMRYFDNISRVCPSPCFRPLANAIGGNWKKKLTTKRLRGLHQTHRIQRTTPNITAVEICILLGYYSASSGNTSSTFRQNVSVPFSRVKNSKKREVGK
jgi:hypothetical protein